MNRNDETFLAQKIRTQYTQKQSTDLDALRALDAKVKRPAMVMAYILGILGALVMGGGMSLVMTEIGSAVGIGTAMPLGIIIGVIGIVLVSVNYPLYKWFLCARKNAYAKEILALSEKIMNN